MLATNTCYFCGVREGRIAAPLVYEDEKMLVILNDQPSVKGHVWVTWKEHVFNASDLTDDEYLHFSRIFQKVEKALLTLLQKDRAVVLKTGGLEPHFHMHIYPLTFQTSWQEIKDIFDRKVRTPYAPGEKEQLIQKLHELMLQ